MASGWEPGGNGPAETRLMMLMSTSTKASCNAATKRVAGSKLEKSVHGTLAWLNAPWCRSTARTVSASAPPVASCRYLFPKKAG